MRGRTFLVGLGVLAALVVPAASTGAAGKSDTPAKPSQPAKPKFKKKITMKKIGKVESPVDLVSPPGNRKVNFILERRGRIRVMRKGRMLKRPFLDITKHVDSLWVEQGLLGLAFPDDYKKTGLFYVHYTDLDGDVRIDEYRRSKKDPYSAIIESRRTVLRIPQTLESQNHNGGQITFHNDLLYIAVGDGNNPGDVANNAQNLESLRGKILRIDPRGDSTRGLNYTIPTTNPFVGKEGRDEIFAYGFRNPHSFDFTKGSDGVTYMTITDVGQERFEELNFLPAALVWGGNFGWKVFEGNTLYDCEESRLCPNPNPTTMPIPSPLVFPQIVYSHEVGCAIIGGPIVSDPALSTIDGRIIYGDFCGNRLRTAAPQVNWISNDEALGVWMPPGKGKHPALNAICEDGWGRIYLLSDYGDIYRLHQENVKVKKPNGKSGKN